MADDLTPPWTPISKGVRTPLEHLEHLQAFLIRERRERPMTRRDISDLDLGYELFCLREEARNYRALWLATLDMIAIQQQRIRQAES